MARMAPKTLEDLVLDDKLDIARTIVRLKHRIQIRHELNDADAEIKQSHGRQVNDGSVTVPVLPTNSGIVNWVTGTLSLSPGDDAEDGSTETPAENPRL